MTDQNKLQGPTTEAREPKENKTKWERRVGWQKAMNESSNFLRNKSTGEAKKQEYSNYETIENASKADRRSGYCTVIKDERRGVSKTQIYDEPYKPNATTQMPQSLHGPCTLWILKSVHLCHHGCQCQNKSYV